jgi:type III secretion protein N (ATPase)
MQRLRQWTQRMQSALSASVAPPVLGRITHVSGMILRAVVPHAKVGDICRLRSPGQGHGNPGGNLAEVVGLFPGGALLTPLGEVQGLGGVTTVEPTGQQHCVGVGDALLGRVLDGMGLPLDESTMGPLQCDHHYPVMAAAPDALKRRVIEQPLPTGIRVIDGLLTCGEGQRVGIFAAAGGGKSTLLGMLVQGAEVDVTVLALIGERGREVREFLEHELSPEARRHCVVVCATSDRSAMERVKAAYVATAIAEYFRDQGKRVLFLMDSVTRFARAQREIGLAAGEPPTRRGFPPSVFAVLPRLLERTGMNDKGSITAFYTVLVEGDDMTEPVADEVRSILDGHIVLSRKLSMANHFPAVDVLASTSRVMGQVAQPSHVQWAARLRDLMAAYAEVELLVRVGEYKSGSDARADQAIDRYADIQAFLRQPKGEMSAMQDTVHRLAAVVH